MTTTAPIPPITGTVTIAASIDKGFELFTGSINAWWPHQYHIGQADVAAVILEPSMGGGGGWALLLDGFAQSVTGR